MTVAGLRRGMQLAMVALAAWAGLSFALGWSRGGVERFCPFGGVETLWAVFTRQSFTCATGRDNLALMAALLLTTLVARKAFCSWLCPVGTVSEWLASAARRLRPKGRRGWAWAGLWQPSRAVDARMRWLRLGVLVAVLAGTGVTAELVFRSKRSNHDHPTLPALPVDRCHGRLRHRRPDRAR